MTDNIYERESRFIPTIREIYTGKYDENLQRTGESCQTWTGTHFQKYTGNFLHDNLHGKGKYIEENDSKSYMYEGTFYANDFEGYSNVTYINGDYFEGLFKRNRRFGPGVYTYADGTQNVGLWYGTQLMRLSCVVLGEWIPKLARSTNAKTKLLKYRKLVPIKQEYEDVAKDLLIKLNARPEVIANSDKLYNPCVRNRNSLFFNKKNYDMEFFGEIDCTIDVADYKSEREPSIYSKLSLINMESPRNIVQEILDYLLENVDIVEGFPQHKRKDLVYESILKAREQFKIETDTKEIRGLLEDFVNELDDLLSKSLGERKLMVNKKTIQKKLPQSDKTKANFTLRKVAVTDLLAWNNEEISIEMLLHVFAHRNRENIVSFSIGKLLTGDRLSFNIPGEIEKNCVVFLNYCSSGNASGVTKIFKDYDLNPDLCDARGNSGIIFAAARDMWSIIKILSDVGANLDMLNDEGLTALGICILRYIALQNDIKDWERAFLPDAMITPEEELQVKEWHPHVSLTDVNLLSSVSLGEPIGTEGENDWFINNCNKVETAFKTMAVEDDRSYTEVYEELRNIEIDMVFKTFQEPYLENVDIKQKYIFNAKCTQCGLTRYGSKSKLPKVDEKDSVSSSRRSKFSIYKRRFKKSEMDVNFIKDNKLKVVFTTIKVLLGCGADPNISQVPLPILLLAIFSHDLQLFNLILNSNADPNIKSEDEGLTALHILASLPFTPDNFEMFDLLLQMKADPNVRTNVYHWVEEKEKIQGKRELLEDDLGKTPLHIISMRYDYANNESIQHQMVELLIQNGARLSDTYLGHDPLTLAILRGNLYLVKLYLDSGLVDPYKVLGEKMGVAMTVLILKRYVNILPVDRCKSVYDLLIEKNVNPLVDMEDYGNCIDFMEAEYEPTRGTALAKKRERSKSKKSSSKSKLSRYKVSSTLSLKKQKLPSEEVRNHLLECGRHVLQKFIQYKAFKYLKRFIMQNVDHDNEVLVTLVKFLPIKDLINLLQLLIRRGVIQPTPSNFYVMLNMLQLSKKYSKCKTKKPKSSDISSLPPPLIIKTFNWMEEEATVYFNMIEPELDASTDKYKVCFYCSRKIKKDLIVCPICGLVYFCSEECNRLSNKHGTVHKCNTLFYNREKILRDNALEDGLEYTRKSKLDDMLENLDQLLRKKFGKDFIELGISGQDFDFDKLNSLLFEKLQQTDFDFSAQVRNLLRESNLTGLEDNIERLRELAKKRKHSRFDEYDDESESDSELMNQASRKKSKGKSSKESRRKKETGIDGSNAKIKEHQKGMTKVKKSKIGERSNKRSDKISSIKNIIKKNKKNDKSSEKFFTKRKPGASRSKSKESAGKTIQTLYQRDRSKGRSDKSSKYAVYKEQIPKSDFTRSRKDKYEQEQIKLREKYKEKLDVGGLWGDKGQFGHRTTFGQMERVFGRLPNKCQFFLEKLSELFPDIDFSMLFWPYVCYVDGQLYYRFLEERPIFLETYSNV